MKAIVSEILVVLLAELVIISDSWQVEWRPNTYFSIGDLEQQAKQHFSGNGNGKESFRLLLSGEDTMLLGSRNMVYNLSMSTLREEKSIIWPAKDYSIKNCRVMRKKEECQNYIRVIVKKDNNELHVCGTNAYSPKCRSYREQETGYEAVGHEVDGVARCPFDPNHNSISTYTDGTFYSATVTDTFNRDPLIFATTQNNGMKRTDQFNSMWLNEPNFVSSFETSDKVYFFFRETAVETINCGKNVFSRVAQVCKQDKGGGKEYMKDTWTSFFKARMNCSIPGQFPFYFDEIQSTSELGQGNYMSTYDSGNRTNMIYAVFNTPPNSLAGSAVCAYGLTDMKSVFEGPFKGQATPYSNWLPVPKDEVVSPRPEKCINDSQKLQFSNLGFIKKHPLMDHVVPAMGGSPLLVFTQLKARLTQIAIDWQVKAADGRYYDVIFAGTDDGRVIKAINKGHGHEIETVIIQEFQAFPDKQAIVNLKVYRYKGMEKLIVVSRKEVVSVPLHRCHAQTTCRSCIKLQDPYCSWAEGKCARSESGLQNIYDAKDARCPDEPEAQTSTTTTTTSTSVPPTQPMHPPIKCDCSGSGSSVTDGGKKNKTKDYLPDDGGHTSIGPDLRLNTPKHVNDKEIYSYESRTAKTQRRDDRTVFSAETLAIALVTAIVVSMVVGFLIGFKISFCRAQQQTLGHNHKHLQQRQNKLSTDSEPHYVNPMEPYHKVTKQLNCVLNDVSKKNGKIPNGQVETQPVHKSNKVYI